uniref:Metallo-beta-lactamase domain-containing protein 1 n=1 Tax=Lepisosteus oculatus TaxID=7918 RepID=W5N9H8_LEPOC
ATAKMDPAQTTPLSIRTEPLGGPEIPGTPYSVAVLKEGYCHPQPDGSTRADGTITLLSGPTVVLVDTGGPWDRDLLLGRLAERGLGPGDVGWVVCTHGHSDHVGNLSLFPGATLVVGFDICQGDRYLCTELAQRRPHAIDEHVAIVPTPGHTGSDVSVLVRGTSLGVVLVAGDLFERHAGEDGWREVSENPELQERSRREVLEVADVIIPGHGAPFRVYREPQRCSDELDSEDTSRPNHTGAA